MAGTVRVKQVVVARQFEAFHYQGDDGYPAAAVFDVVGIDLHDGRQFFLPNGVRRQPTAGDLEDGWPVVGFRARYDAEAIAAKVAARGLVDLQYWVELEPQPSLEERLQEEAYREQAERVGLSY